MEARPVVGSLDAQRWLLRNLQWGLLSAGSLVGAVAGMLMLRRLSGEFHTALSSPVYLTSAVLFAAVAVGMRRAYTSVAAFVANPTTRLTRAYNFLPTVGLIIFVIAITLPATASAAIMLATLLIVGVLVEALIAPRNVPRHPSRESHRLPIAEVWSERDLEHPEKELPEEEVEEVGGDETILLRLTHGRAEEGGEFWHGIVRTEFVVGQRTAAAHVAFCPAFGLPPQITAWHLSGEAAEIRVTQSLPQGTRLEIRLSEPASEPLHVVLEFTAHDSRPTTDITHISQHR